MPVQINEVIIRAVVDNSNSTTTPAAPGSSTGQPVPDIEIAAMVLEIIKEKNER